MDAELRVHQTGKVEAADESSVASLYRRHITMVRRQGRRITGSDAAAEDVAQEAFVRLIELRSKPQDIDNEAAYLFRTVTNLGLNRIRNKKRRRELLEQQGPSEPAPPELDTQLTVRKLLAQVPEADAQIAAYYYLASMDQEEIAQFLNINRRMVGRRLQRFRSRAQAILAKEERRHV